MAALLWEIQGQQAAHSPQRLAHWVRASLGLWYYERHAAERYAAAERLVRRFGCSDNVTQTLAANGEQWDGAGYPGQRAGTAIPIAARIVSAAQTAVVLGERLPPAAVAARLKQASGGRFDPTVVRVLHGILTAQLPATANTWLDALIARARQDVPESLHGRTIAATRLAAFFADIVDAKSPFTASHSARVAALAGAMARLAGSAPEQVASTLLAGLLHDLGKLGVPNLILDKPAPQRRYSCHWPPAGRRRCLRRDDRRSALPAESPG
jgi:HD-GYP domain-containing protein (c-di-GMP phosphodiesterase class II)